MNHLDREFERLLCNHSVRDLDSHAGAVYGVWPDFRLAYLNPSWFQFSRENGGEPEITAQWGLGRSILDCLSGDVRVFYEARLRRVLESHRVWNHEYECSSPTVYRRWHQIVYPLGREDGLVIVNSLVYDRPHSARDRPAKEADRVAYDDENGFVVQCAHCRRVKHNGHAERWDWVPEWVGRCPPYTSHSFCPACFLHYYPHRGAGRTAALSRTPADLPQQFRVVPSVLPKADRRTVEDRGGVA